MARFIKALHEVAVTIDEEFPVQFWTEIKSRLRGVAGGIRFQPPFFQESTIETSLRQGVQKSHHGGHHSRMLNELELPLENVGAIVVEPDDEPTHHFEAGPLQDLDGFREITMAVLQFPAFYQAFGRGRLNASQNSQSNGQPRENCTAMAT